MRRSLALLVPFIPSLLLAGCEDGPTQTFSPAPGNAGNVWNNGNTPAAVDDASTPLIAATGGGTSKTEICNGAELQDQWKRMVQQPIVPPYHIAGVDLSGINYQSLSVEQAENGVNGKLFPAPGAMNPPTRLCQGAPQGAGGNGGDCGGGGGSLVTTWGNNSEFLMEWCVNTHKDLYNSLNPGYVGTMEWDYTCELQGGISTCMDFTTGKASTTDNTKHHYVWQLGKPITRTDTNGKPVNYRLDWNGYGTPPKAFDIEADELYRGLTQAFIPELYDDLKPGIHCKDVGRCPYFPTGNAGVYPILGFRTISMYWEMDPPTLPQPSGTTPHDAYFFNIKYAPYSPAVSVLKMDAQGPTAELSPIGNLTPPKDCKLSLDATSTFGNLKANCINVFQDPNVNSTALAKVLGNLSHDDNDFTFSVVGINQNYRPPELDIGGSRQFDIIHDSEIPADNAVASDFTYDVRANGPIMNDRYKTATAGVFGRDNHGAGAVWREYQRRAQQDITTKLHAKYGTPIRTLHDPACLVPMTCQGPGTCATNTTVSTCGADASGCAWAYAPGFNINTWRAAPGCTGLEGLITTAYPNTNAQTGLPVNPADPKATDPDNVNDLNLTGLSQYYIPNGLRPGTPTVMICMDPAVQNFCGPGWNGPLQGAYGALFDMSYQMVTQIGGGGDVRNLPTGVGDYRYFFQKWSEAMATYFASGAALHTGPHDPAGPDPVPYFGPPNAACTDGGKCGANSYVLNTDDMFFDAFGGNANKSEFAVFDYADAKNDPLTVQLDTLLIGTNLQQVHFFKRLDREERAIYMAMEGADGQTAKQAAWGLLRNAGGAVVKDEWGVPVKAANVFLTNLAGSPTLTKASEVTTGGTTWHSAGKPAPAGYYDPCNPATPTKDENFCASHVQDADCEGVSPGNSAPVDAAGNMITKPNGDPLLYGYCGVWYGSPFQIGSTAIKLINKDITPQQQVLEQEQEVEIPVYANPYDTTTKSTPLHVLVPWMPQGGNVGYAVPSTGQTDVFVSTEQMDFSGQIITPLVDFTRVTIQPDGGQAYTAASIKAIESQDFLGDVFLCYDTVTAGVNFPSGNPGDILSARMYTSVKEMLDWITNHPTAQDQCSIIVRYSPYNNYPDFISSLANGVKVSIDPGVGFGRVVDATLYDPATGTAPPP